MERNNFGATRNCQVRWLAKNSSENEIAEDFRVQGSRKKVNPNTHPIRSMPGFGNSVQNQSKENKFINMKMKINKTKLTRNLQGKEKERIFLGIKFT